MRRIPALVLVLLLSLAIGGCSGGSDSAPTATPSPAASATAAATVETLPVIEIGYAGGVIRAEVASTAAQRTRGLGGRVSLGGDAGMLFDLEGARVASFWMKDTLIPLDMLWIGEDHRVAGIAADVQPEPGVADADLRRYSSVVPVRYVLELNAGAAAALGIAVGDQLRW